MRRVAGDCTVHSRVDSQRVTSILWGQRKVCARLGLHVSSNPVTIGWTPSTFVSSRADRSKKKQARPEDFMDEEDLAELRESRQLVDENDEMDFGGTEAELRRRAGESAEDEYVVCPSGRMCVNCSLLTVP